MNAPTGKCCKEMPIMTLKHRLIKYHVFNNISHISIWIVVSNHSCWCVGLVIQPNPLFCSGKKVIAMALRSNKY